MSFMGSQKKHELGSRISAKTHRRIMIIFVAWVSSFYLISIFLYSLTKEFSISTIWISSLGDPGEHVLSIYIFNPGMFLSLFLLLPHYYYLYFRIPIKWKPFKILTTSLLVMGALGFGLVGAFPNTIQPYHDVAAGFYLGGMGLGYVVVNLFYLVLGLRCAAQPATSDDDQHKNKGMLITIISLTAFVFLVVADGTFIVKYLTGNTIGIVIWEWLAFFSTMTNLLSVCFLLDIEIKFFLKAEPQ